MMQDSLTSEAAKELKLEASTFGVPHVSTHPLLREEPEGKGRGQ